MVAVLIEYWLTVQFEDKRLPLLIGSQLASSGISLSVCAGGNFVCCTIKQDGRS